jgi:hypothetical protein
MTESVSKQRWIKSVVAALIALAIVATLGYGYASPYVTLNRLKVAADARDAATLNEYVDYPALRLSLKQQVGELLQRRVEAQHSSNPLLLFGAMIGAALIGPLVDAYATPDGVAALLNGMPPSGKPGEQPPPAGNTEAAPAPAAPAPNAQNAAPEPRPQASAGYRTFNEFVVTWQRSANGERYSAVLQRHGLFSWKLAAVELNDPAQ